MEIGRLSTHSRNDVRDRFQLFSKRLLEEPMKMSRPKFPMAENYWPAKPWAPTCDIFETANEIVLKFELPEVIKEDVSITMEGHLLSVSGERRFAEEADRDHYHRVERHYGKFMRKFNVPMFIDATKINAEIKNGVLTVRLPKREGLTTNQLNVKIA